MRPKFSTYSVRLIVLTLVVVGVYGVLLKTQNDQSLRGQLARCYINKIISDPCPIDYPIEAGSEVCYAPDTGVSCMCGPTSSTNGICGAGTCMCPTGVCCYTDGSSSPAEDVFEQFCIDSGGSWHEGGNWQTCQSQPPPNLCGNGQLDAGELCDGGANCTNCQCNSTPGSVMIPDGSNGCMRVDLPPPPPPPSPCDGAPSNSCNQRPDGRTRTDVEVENACDTVARIAGDWGIPYDPTPRSDPALSFEMCPQLLSTCSAIYPGTTTTWEDVGYPSCNQISIYFVEEWIGDSCCGYTRPTMQVRVLPCQCNDGPDSCTVATQAEDCGDREFCLACNYDPQIGGCSQRCISDQCGNNARCSLLPEDHSCSTCNTCSGLPAITCDPDYYAYCCGGSDWQCIPVNSAAEDANAYCNFKGNTHAECVEGKCVLVPGAGENLCDSDADCSTTSSSSSSSSVSQPTSSSSSSSQVNKSSSSSSSSSVQPPSSSSSSSQGNTSSSSSSSSSVQPPSSSSSSSSVSSSSSSQSSSSSSSSVTGDFGGDTGDTGDTGTTGGNTGDTGDTGTTGGDTGDTGTTGGDTGTTGGDTGDTGDTGTTGTTGGTGDSGGDSSTSSSFTSRRVVIGTNTVSSSSRTSRSSRKSSRLSSRSTAPIKTIAPLPTDLPVTSSAPSKTIAAQPACRRNEDCSPGLICSNGRCLPCTQNSQCDTGFCISGLCSAQPFLEPTRIVAASAVCGDGTLQPPEECDDGNRVNGDGCTTECLIEFGVCGDGVIQKLLGEQCEPSLHRDTLPYDCINCRYVPIETNSSEATQVAGEIEDTLVLPAATTERPMPTMQQFASQHSSQVTNVMYQYQFPQPPLAQLQPLIVGRAPAGDTGPAAVVVIGAGAAGGIGWVRRRRRGR